MSIQSNKELAVAALRDGTVIDHIPSEALFKVVNLLGIKDLDTSVTIGFNLDSKRMGKKGIIKVAGLFFPEETLNRIAVIAPHAVINIIRDYSVVDKHPVTLADDLIDIVQCNNPNCITNNEPMRTHFRVVDHDNITLRCHYCERLVHHGDVTLK